LNGHDVPDALLRVHRSHIDPAIRELAGQAHDEVLRSRLLWDAYMLDFTTRDRESR